MWLWIWKEVVSNDSDEPVKTGEHEFDKNLEATLKFLVPRMVPWSKFHFEDPKNIMRHRTKFSRHGDLEPGVCALLY
jgi:hypothetical protein